MTVAFEQAAIRIEKVEEFQQLQHAIESVLSPEKVMDFLKGLQRGKIRVRDFESVIVTHRLDAVTGKILNSRQLYNALSLSDQAQLREFYLSKIEEVEPALRARFHKVYQYS